MEYGTRGVKGLKLILNVECREDIVGKVNGKMRGVGVIGRLVLSRIGRGLDVGITAKVVLRKTEGGRLRGSSLKVVEITVHLLIVGETLSHMVEDFL